MAFSGGPITSWTDLEDNARRATALIQLLTSTKEELRAALPRGTPQVPRSELHFCSGLAFTFVRKLGMGLSFESGTGFVIRKLRVDGGTPERPAWTWSAPLFINLGAGGLGLTLGYTRIESVVVLDSDEAVQGFTRTQLSLDTDVTGTMPGVAGAHLPATAANLSTPRLSDKTFSYSIVRGAMLDVSLTGLSYSVDERMNMTLYGPRVSPQAILNGGVEPPEPMQELYAALDHILAEYYEQVQELAEAEVEEAAVLARRERGAPPGDGAGTSAAAAAAGMEEVGHSAEVPRAAEGQGSGIVANTEEAGTSAAAAAAGGDSDSEITPAPPSAAPAAAGASPP